MPRYGSVELENETIGFRFAVEFPHAAVVRPPAVAVPDHGRLVAEDDLGRCLEREPPIIGVNLLPRLKQRDTMVLIIHRCLPCRI